MCLQGGANKYYTHTMNNKQGKEPFAHKNHLKTIKIDFPIHKKISIYQTFLDCSPQRKSWRTHLPFFYFDSFYLSPSLNINQSNKNCYLFEPDIIKIDSNSQSTQNMIETFSRKNLGLIFCVQLKSVKRFDVHTVFFSKKLHQNTF